MASIGRQVYKTKYATRVCRPVLALERAFARLRCYSISVNREVGWRTQQECQRRRYCARPPNRRFESPDFGEPAARNGLLGRQKGLVTLNTGDGQRIALAVKCD